MKAGYRPAVVLHECLKNVMSKYFLAFKPQCIDIQLLHRKAYKLCWIIEFYEKAERLIKATETWESCLSWKINVWLG